MDQSSDSTGPDSTPTPTPTPETPAPETPAPEAPKATEDVSVSLNDPITPSVTDPAAAPTPAAGAADPGHGLGIASLVVSIIGMGLVGIILGAIGLNKSKKAGHSNGLAIAGIIVGALNVIVVTIIIIVAAMGVGQLAGKCAELGNGVHIENGVTYTCNL